MVTGIVVPIMAFLISAGSAWVLSRGLIPWLEILDHPNQRSLHQRPIPRTGGLAILVALLVVASGALLAHAGDRVPLSLAVAIALVAGVSFGDDRRGVGPVWRLLAQFVAAGLLLVGGLGWTVVTWPGGQWLAPAPVAAVLTVLYVTWMINLYNFMDGSDGLAGGMAVIGFAALAVLGWQGGAPVFATTAAAIAAAAGGFLVCNFPPAKLFLGDVGSASLGLLAAALGLWGNAAGLFPLWVAWLAFAPFIVDATWTLLVRLVRGEPVWRPHRSHHYQRLILSGWSHRRTALRAYILMAACGASAIAAPRLPAAEQWLLLVTWAAIYGLIHAKVRLIEQGRRGVSS